MRELVNKMEERKMEDEEDEELREREKIFFFQINFTSSIHYFFHPFFNYYNPSPLIQL